MNEGPSKKPKEAVLASMEPEEEKQPDPTDAVVIITATIQERMDILPVPAKRAVAQVEAAYKSLLHVRAYRGDVSAAYAVYVQAAKNLLAEHSLWKAMETMYAPESIEHLRTLLETNIERLTTVMFEDYVIPVDKGPLQ
ncbi:MAG: hypothetical protein JWM39_553 [Parcubacteria group bacterium]|jgi:hypothetical protein|nr:hypothetical protein [Parcubacteria group bacterium]